MNQLSRAHCTAHCVSLDVSLYCACVCVHARIRMCVCVCVHDAFAQAWIYLRQLAPNALPSAESQP